MHACIVSGNKVSVGLPRSFYARFPKRYLWPRRVEEDVLHGKTSEGLLCGGGLDILLHYSAQIFQLCEVTLSS